jgi:Homing endonuclease associated repeat
LHVVQHALIVLDDLFAKFSRRSILFASMPRKRPYRAITSIDPAELAAFQAEIRRRYSDGEILDELRACAERLGRSPTMKEFGADPATRVHPQTVIEHFGSWNKAKRQAGLVPRRFATREELLGLLQELGRRLGRVPTAKDVDANRGWMPSKSLYWHTFGSLTNALKEAGFDVPVGEERLERAIEQGSALAVRLGRLPKFTDWAAARREDAELLTEWQVYRMFDARRGAWSTFQYLVRQRLRDEGAMVERDGVVRA